MIEKEKEYRAALYCRLSSDDAYLGESGSIKTQRALLTQYCKENNIPVNLVNRIDAKSNTMFDLMLTDTVDLVIDIPTRNNNLKDGFLIRRFAVEAGIPIFTSLDTAQALITSLEKRHKGDTTLVDITRLK